MSEVRRLTARLLTFFLFFALTPAFANPAYNPAQVSQTWQMLDYLGIDYAGAVSDGQITNEAEYAEMQEFSAAIRQSLSELPAGENHATLLANADNLVQLVAEKAAAEKVSQQAVVLANALLAAYPIPTAPKKLPDLAHGAKLYQTHCAACHGASGNADGTLSESLDPPAIAFTDKERADQRSPLSYYQTVTQGVEGTRMAAFQEQLDENDRWSVAYFAASLNYADAVAQGQQLWKKESLARAAVHNLNELSMTRVETLAGTLGHDNAQAVLAYLRQQPDALNEALSGIALARGRLAASLAAYESGDKKDATQLALSAYLDGVEPVEPLLNTRNPKLRASIELAMGAYRTQLGKSGVALEDLRAQANAIDALLLEADNVTQEAAASSIATFTGAFAILLREGLEALLVVVALLAFLSKANRREVVGYVHGGWVAALAAGVATWVVARYVIDISGASRELTEGFSALFAVVMLLSIGLWMHQKSIGNRWQTYIKEKMSTALNKKSAWFLFILAFVTVYREAFETILFMVALWNAEQAGWVLGGILSAVAVLAVLAWLLLKTSNKLPLSTFFAASSALIALLALVLTGKGVSALQEAGWVAVTAAPVPHIDLLGIFPTWETTLAQLFTLALLVAGYFYNKRNAGKEN